MSVVATYRSGVREHGFGAIGTLTRYYAARAVGLITGPGRECPLCDATVREFLPFVELRYGFVRNRAACPSCGALERHRAYARFYRDFIPANFMLPIDILHASAEESLGRVLGRFARRYDLTDYESPPPGHIHLDICEPHLPPASYDLIVLNHVLMCVADDRRAVRALSTLLRPGGMILAGEGILRGERTASQREAGYGGRYNQYGDADIATRFAPMETEVIDVSADLAPSERARFGIADHETLFVIRPPRG
ncbi:MAG: methyltransferase domain-containing protein [Gemmatimonadaceae bacterium]|nr:methyltransferase domain-containing protein [Gemmatimonadaceae bacterium]